MRGREDWTDGGEEEVDCTAGGRRMDDWKVDGELEGNFLKYGGRLDD